MEHASFALKKCPFLARLAEEHGEDYATSIAIAPTKPVGSEPLPAGTDAVCGLAESFRMFHGPQGIFPLAKSSSSAVTVFSGSRPGCPFHARAQETKSSGAKQQPSGALPFATISLSNFGKGPDFGDFIRKRFNNSNSHQRPNRHQPQRPAGNNHAAQPPQGPGATSSNSLGSSSSSNSGLSSSGGHLKPQRPLGNPNGPSGTSSGRGLHGGGSSSSSSRCSSAPAPGHGGTTASWSSSSTGALSSSQGPSPLQQKRLRPGGSPGGSSSGSHSGSGADSRGGGRTGGAPTSHSAGAAGGSPSGCPLRKWLGPAAGLVFNQYDKLVCPPAIVAARAALAKTAAVQQLRPQALPVKLVAVAAVVAGVNLPCGAVREHFEKFSLGWFIAVHATIPFVAMLRKAVIMPKYAMVVTIAAAVVGQLIGSRLERLRLGYEAEHGPLLLLPQQWAAATPSLSASTPSQTAAAAVTSRSSRGVTAGAAAVGSDDGGGCGGSSGRVGHWWQGLLEEPEVVGSGGGVAAGGVCGSSVLHGGPLARLPCGVRAA